MQHTVVKIASHLSDDLLDAACAHAAKEAAARGLPFAESCEYNKIPIHDALRSALNPSAPPLTALEIGSGTAQHALHLLGAFNHDSGPKISKWQLSEMPGDDADVAKCEMHATRKVHASYTSSDAALAERLMAPVQLDVSNPSDWTSLAQCAGHPFNFVFTANTFHIMPWASALNCLDRVSSVMQPGGIFAIYGPFNYSGTFTTDSNRRFDGWLKSRNALSGIRDFEAVRDAAVKNGFELIVDFDMPANNRLLLFVFSNSTRSSVQLYRALQPAAAP